MPDNQLNVTFRFGLEGGEAIKSFLGDVEKHVQSINEKHGTAGARGAAGGGKELEEVAKGAETAGKAIEALRTGMEGIGQALISGSLQTSITAFQRFGSSVGEAAGATEGFLSKFGLVGEVAAGVFATLTAGAVIATELAQHMSENVLEFSELAKAAGLTEEKFANLEGAFQRAGVGLDQLHQIVRVTSNRLAAEWGDIVRTVRDSADKLEEGGFRVSDTQRKIIDSYTAPAEALRKTETAQLAARSAEAAVPGAERTKEGTELELFKAQLEFKSKYDEFGNLRAKPLPTSGEDKLSLQQLQEHADRSHIEALKAQEEEDDRNIKRAKMNRERAEEQEVAAGRNAPFEATEGMERAQIGGRAAQRAQADLLLTNPAVLAQSIQAGGAGTNWREAGPQNIFRALALMGGGTVLGSLNAASAFMNMPSVQGDEFGALRQAVTGQFTGGRMGAAAAEEAIRRGGFGEGTPQTAETARLMRAATPTAEVLREGSAETSQQIRAGVINAGMGLAPIAVGAERGLGGAVEGLGQGVGGVVGAVKQGFGDLSEAAHQTAGALREIAQYGLKGALEKSSPESMAKQPGLQSGGLVSGPGTGTSDSIRAPWLSSGEYVLPARRVAQEGISALDALRDGTAKIVGYQEGGFITSDVPEFDPAHAISMTFPVHSGRHGEHPHPQSQAAWDAAYQRAEEVNMARVMSGQAPLDMSAFGIGREPHPAADLSIPFESLPIVRRATHHAHYAHHAHHRPHVWGIDEGPHFSAGGLVGAATADAGSDISGSHILDLRTDGGNFRATAASDVVEAIRSSSIAHKLTSTGSPSWRT